MESETRIQKKFFSAACIIITTFCKFENTGSLKGRQDLNKKSSDALRRLWSGRQNNLCLFRSFVQKRLSISLARDNTFPRRVVAD